MSSSSRRQQLIARHYVTMFRHAGVTALYRRPPCEAEVQLTVVPAFTRTEDQDDAGVITEVQIPDFLIRGSDLILDGVPATPKPGDQIVIEQPAPDGRVFTYEVMAPLATSGTGSGGAEAAWRWSDQDKTYLRVHTKLVNQQAPAP